MRDALAHLAEAGCLIRRRGGFWTEPGAQPTQTRDHFTPYDTWDWYASTRTVYALEGRGLVRVEGDRAVSVAQ